MIFMVTPIILSLIVWVKYDKPNSVNSVDYVTTQPQLTSRFGNATSNSSSSNALIIYLSMLFQPLHAALPSSFIATLAKSCNIACTANSSPSSVNNFSTHKRISCILSLLFLHHVKHHTVLSNGSSCVLHPTKPISLPYSHV